MNNLLQDTNIEEMRKLEERTANCVKKKHAIHIYIDNEILLTLACALQVHNLRIAQLFVFYCASLAAETVVHPARDKSGGLRRPYSQQ